MTDAIERVITIRKLHFLSQCQYVNIFLETAIDSVTFSQSNSMRVTWLASKPRYYQM